MTKFYDGMFYFEGKEGSLTLFVYDNIKGERHDLYGINTAEEAEDVCTRLNASIKELLSLEGEEYDPEIQMP